MPFLVTYWGLGIATEATQAILGFGFNILGLHRIDATFDPRNKASGRVLEKSGFQYEDYCETIIFRRMNFAIVS